MYAIMVVVVDIDRRLGSKTLFVVGNGVVVEKTVQCDRNSLKIRGSGSFLLIVSTIVMAIVERPVK